MNKTSTKRVAINGLGRIGRMVLRRYFEENFDRSGLQIVAANDLASADSLAYLFKYDSVHGRYNGNLEYREDAIYINGNEISLSAEKDPRKLPWKALDIDIVLECTGLFTSKEQLEWHLQAGAKKVILSAPAKDDVFTIVMGVNDEKYINEKHHVMSNASCTTNSLAPVAKVLLDRFGIDSMFATTVHAYTSSQALIDKPSSKKSKGRSATLSIIPSTTGAAKATAQVIPELVGKMEAIALRIPIPDGAITEIVANLQKDVSVDSINQAIREASMTDKLAGVLGYSDDDLVSIDIIGDSHSTLVNTRSTKVLGRNMVYMQTWYDNEWGYSCRLVDLAQMVALKMEVAELVTVSLA